MGLVAVMPIALGAVVLNRYDVWPVLFVSLALLSVVAGRDRLGFGLLAAGAVIKIFPAVLLPVAALHVLRTRGRRALVGALVTFAAVSLALTLPLAALAPGGFGFSVKTQVIRQLQLESLAASILLAADKVGIYSARIVAGKPGSLDLGGTLPDLLGVVSDAAPGHCASRRGDRVFARRGERRPASERVCCLGCGGDRILQGDLRRSS